MSVVVVGMEMPRTGWGCPLNSYGICIAKHEISDNCYEELPDWCPLRPLPEKHGRLADLDAIIRELRSGKSETEEGYDGVKKPGSSLVLELLIGYLDGRPTIVEAEGQSEPLTISGTAYYIDGVIYLEPDCNQGEDTT